MYIFTAMSDDTQKFNLDTLSQLTDIPVRTIRYYIQSGLIAKPKGVGRGAHYGSTHLDQLLEIKKWQAAGLSLARIQELLEGRGDEGLVPPKPAAKPGDISVWSRIHLHDGLELHIEPQAAGLSPEQTRALIAATLEAYQRITQSSDEASSREDIE